MSHPLDDINRDIWRPFQRSYAALDLAGYLDFHSPDLVRVEVGARWIGGRDEYAARVKRGFDYAAERGDTFAIDFHFTERIVGDDAAYERGVYRVSITAPDGGVQLFHGRFNTVSRRTDDGWRLALDQDDDEGGTVDAAAFEAGHTIDDLTPFT